MKSLLLAAFLSIYCIGQFSEVAQAQGSKSKPTSKSSTSKKVTAGKNSFITTTTTTTEVPAPTTSYPQQNYTAPVVSPPANTTPATTNTRVATPPATAPASPVNNSASSNAVPNIGAPINTVAATATPEPPTPWKVSYFGEYFGPRLSNIDLSKYQGPESSEPSWGWIDHSFKLGYQVHKNHIIGTQIRAKTPFDPDGQFAFKNTRIYGTWSNMIDTPDVNLKTVVDLEFPTSDKARWAGNVLNINIKMFWTLNTQLRNWTFSAMTMLRPMFYDNPNGQGDLYLGLFPWIQMDFAPDWALVFEGSFDASHSYQDMFFNFGSDDPDYIRAGVQYSFNSHFQINPAFQFYTGNFSFKAATLYMSLSAAL